MFANFEETFPTTVLNAIVTPRKKMNSYRGLIVATSTKICTRILSTEFYKTASLKIQGLPTYKEKTYRLYNTKPK